MTSNTVLQDARVANVLSDVPAFAIWHNRPLNRQLRQLLSELDTQTLMSVTAYSLHRLIDDAEESAGGDRYRA